jgi:hypothetical protein
LPVLVFFNELSCTADVAPTDVHTAMDGFVRVLRDIHKLRSDLALVSIAGLTSLELARGYYLSQWIADPANRDRWRFIRGLQNRAPFSDVLPEGAGDGVAYHFSDQPAQGLGAAHLMDGLALSLTLRSEWDTAEVELVREVLTELADGSIALIEEPAQVRHCATSPHVAVHEGFVRRSGIGALTGGAGIWEDRAGFFPHLRFLDRVEDDLRGLPADWLKPVAEELIRLEAATALWNPAEQPFPTWLSRVTPEGETRKRLCVFTDLDGSERVFDLHARFTPRAGRLHFGLDPAARRVVIAYIGAKIGS